MSNDTKSGILCFLIWETHFHYLFYNSTNVNDPNPAIKGLKGPQTSKNHIKSGIRHLRHFVIHQIGCNVFFVRETHFHNIFHDLICLYDPNPAIQGFKGP